MQWEAQDTQIPICTQKEPAFASKSSLIKPGPNKISSSTEDDTFFWWEDEIELLCEVLGRNGGRCFGVVVSVTRDLPQEFNLNGKDRHTD
jgi:hypothetical protein